MGIEFGKAPVKGEGMMVSFDDEGSLSDIETTYVERRVPNHLEDEAHELIDNWLKSKGYDPEEL